MALRDRLAHAWNAFTSRSQEDRINSYYHYGEQSSISPGRTRLNIAGDKSIINTIYNQIAVDFAAESILHVKLDQNGRFQKQIDSGINNCLTLEANVDQSASAFMIDVILTLFDQGTIAIVPVDTTLDPAITGSWDVQTMRVGKIVAWYPQAVRVNLYNDQTGRREDVVLPKAQVAIVENPFYSTMNEPNGTLKRLIRKLSLLDSIDEQVGSGKLDMIIQLPYVIKSEARREQAENRRKDIEVQLNGSKYGIAYTDGTERITQLNRPVENNMLSQIEYLTNLLYSQLGLTQEVFNGTATETVMLNYYNRTIKPLLTAVSQAIKRTFLTKTARSQGQSIEFYRDPFSLVPVASMADIADKFTRNEILTSNEVRTALGIKPSNEPNADELRNKNLNSDQSGNPNNGTSAPAQPTAGGSLATPQEGAPK